MSILFGLAVAGSLGLAGWAYTAGDSVDKQLQEIENLGNQVRGLAGSAANVKSIEERKKVSENRNQKIDQTVNDALRAQNYNVFEGRPRQLLIPGILPESTKDSDLIDFKGAYTTAFAELNERLNARDEPSPEEIIAASRNTMDTDGDVNTQDRPWSSAASIPGGPVVRSVGPDVTTADVLRSNPVSGLSERIAKQIFMYVDEGARTARVGTPEDHAERRAHLARPHDAVDRPGFRRGPCRTERRPGPAT